MSTVYNETIMSERTRSTHYIYLAKAANLTPKGIVKGYKGFEYLCCDNQNKR